MCNFARTYILLGVVFYWNLSPSVIDRGAFLNAYDLIEFRWNTEQLYAMPRFSNSEYHHSETSPIRSQTASQSAPPQTVRTDVAFNVTPPPIFQLPQTSTTNRDQQTQNHPAEKWLHEPFSLPEHDVLKSVRKRNNTFDCHHDGSTLSASSRMEIAVQPQKRQSCFDAFPWHTIDDRSCVIKDESLSTIKPQAETLSKLDKLIEQPKYLITIGRCSLRFDLSKFVQTLTTCEKETISFALAYSFDGAPLSQAGYTHFPRIFSDSLFGLRPRDLVASR